LWWLEEGGAFVGYVKRAKVAFFANCFENVLSNTKAYIPPWSAGTSCFPVNTFSASHFPYQVTVTSPMLFNFSTAVEESFLEEDARRPLASGFEVGASNADEELRLGVREAPVPGCLNSPKFLSYC
jgi:hypothetical protein